MSRSLTQILEDWRRRHPGATAELVERSYPELQRIARARLSGERRDHTFEARALVHEAFLRLLEQRHVAWRDRKHFFLVAATMMRRVLLNHARDRACAKRGGGVPALPLEDELLPSGLRPARLIELDEALERLAGRYPELATVVELRFFGGFLSTEIAETLGVSEPTVRRRWRMARAWLYHQLGEEEAPRGEGS